MHDLIPTSGFDLRPLSDRTTAAHVYSSHLCGAMLKEQIKAAVAVTKATVAVYAFTTVCPQFEVSPLPHIQAATKRLWPETANVLKLVGNYADIGLREFLTNKFEALAKGFDDTPSQVKLFLIKVQF